MEFDGREIGATVSMGMAICEDGALDMSAMLAQADEALYCAKERGRNRIEAASLQMALDRAQEEMSRQASLAPAQSPA